MYYHHKYHCCHHKYSSTRSHILKNFLQEVFSDKFPFSAEETNCSFSFFMFRVFLSNLSLFRCFFQNDCVWGGCESH
jgi:hypothetical protein